MEDPATGLCAQLHTLICSIYPLMDGTTEAKVHHAPLPVHMRDHTTHDTPGHCLSKSPPALAAQQEGVVRLHTSAASLLFVSQEIEEEKDRLFPHSFDAL